MDDIDTYPDNIPKEALEGTAITIQDWPKAQADYKNIAYIVKCLSAKSKPSRQEIDRKNIDNRYKAEWERYRLKSGILYRTYQVEDEEFQQLVLPESLRDIILKAIMMIMDIKEEKEPSLSSISVFIGLVCLNMYRAKCSSVSNALEGKHALQKQLNW